LLSQKCPKKIGTNAIPSRYTRNGRIAQKGVVGMEVAGKKQPGLDSMYSWRVGPRRVIEIYLGTSAD
jgi:hypothetical protein